MRRGGRTTTADLLKHAGALYPLPLPTERGGSAIPWGPCRAWGRRSSSSLHQWVTGQRPSRHTGLPKIHRSQRKSISLQTEHPLLRWRHLHWGSASAAVRRRGCAPSSAPEINTQTWATAAFIIAARFICWLSRSKALRQNISSQREEEQRVDAFVSVLLKQ